jgi:hypothetical protein
VLASLAPTPRTLSGWRLTDRNGRTTAVNVTIRAGTTAPIALDSTGVQLGNNGGHLVLHDDSDTMIDSVVYDNVDAGPEDRYVRFRH